MVVSIRELMDQTVENDEQDLVPPDGIEDLQGDGREDNDLIDLYDALCVEDGQPVYLCDGVWLYPNGDVRDESGR
jgi:hypothetical protein